MGTLISYEKTRDSHHWLSLLNQEYKPVMKEPRDHILAVCKAGISAVPVVGGTIASLIGDYIPTATENTIGESVNILSKRIEKLGNRIDAKCVNKDEFSELFKSCYLIIIRTHQQKKIQGAVELICNILLKKGDADKLIYTEIDYFTRCLDALSIGSIEVLGHVVAAARTKYREHVGKENVRMSFTDVHNQVPTIEADLLMGLLGELNSFHLVFVNPTPGVRMANYQLSTVELPPMGSRFAKYILQI
jgi:hypothetical protein